MKPIQQGDLVTVSLEVNSDASNTYAVARKLEGESLLSHPLVPNVFLLKKDEELNLVGATLKNDEERCLAYALKFQKYLDYDDVAVLEALSMYFIVHHRLTKRQNKLLANMAGEIAKVYCNNDLEIAIRTVNENRALLNDFNRHWYENFEKIFQGSQRKISVAQRAGIFNMCGFVLAQLEGISTRR